MRMRRIDNAEEDDEKDEHNDVAEGEVEVDDVEDDEPKEQEDDEVENDDVEEEEDDDLKDDDVEEEDRSQDRYPHFARACAVKMHLDISQEPLYAEIYRKNAGARWSTLIKHRPLHSP